VSPDTTNRKLAAILAADVVGYSRLMGEAEEATLRALTACRTVIDGLIATYGGRVFGTAGDSVMAEFASSVEAVRCAIEMQETLAGRAAPDPEHRRMRWRIGVNLGEVVVAGEQIYGDGVNIAARLESLAEPGGICISDVVRRQVRNKLDLGYEDLGEQRLKNISEPVRVYRVRPTGAPAPKTKPRFAPRALLAVGLLLVVAVGGWLLWPHTPPKPTAHPDFFDRPAIAVLPFDNLSGDPEQEYFADGIAEDLLTRLSSSGRVPVIARNSSFTYKGKAVDVKQVGRELGARYVVEGSVRRSENRVRVSVQLIDATSGAHVWAERYDRGVQDLFALQDEITEQIAGSTDLAVFRSEQQRAVRQQPEKLDAWDASMRGSWCLFHFTREENARARSFFEKAAELAPSSAVPCWGLAATHFADRMFDWTESPDQSAAELGKAAKECMALNDAFWGCHAAMAFFYRVNGEAEHEIASLERGIELNPSNAALYGFLAQALAVTGRPDAAIANVEKAMRLSPRDPGLPWWLINTGFAHFAAKRYEDAVAAAERSLQLRPDNPSAYRTLAASYAQLGRVDEARRALEQEVRLEPGISLAKVRQQNPTSEPDFLRRWLDGLRQAGLKE